MAFKQVFKHFEFQKEDISAGKYTAWELIQPLWYTVSIYNNLEEYNEDLKPFSDAQRNVFAFMWYDAEVCNGGHDQFFSNSTGIVWKDALECMKMIGADKHADNFQAAIDIFGGSVPFERDKRNKILETLYKDKKFDGFEKIDKFYFSNENITPLLNEYIKFHAAEFVLNGDFLYYE